MTIENIRRNEQTKFGRISDCLRGSCPQQRCFNTKCTNVGGIWETNQGSLYDCSNVLPAQSRASISIHDPGKFRRHCHGKPLAAFMNQARYGWKYPYYGLPEEIAIEARQSARRRSDQELSRSPRYEWRGNSYLLVVNAPHPLYQLVGVVTPCR